MAKGLYTFRDARGVMNKMEMADNYWLEMRAPKGQEPVFDSELIQLMKQFITDAEDIGVPRSRSRMAVDIQEYVRQEKIPVPFNKQRPGDSCSLFNWYI